MTLMLSAITTTATSTASAVTQRGATSSPILRLSAVNMTSGTMANGSCMLRITWLRMSSLPVPAVAVKHDADDRRDDGERRALRAGAPTPAAAR